MSKETHLKFRFSLGSVIMWISFLLPFITMLLRLTALEIQTTIVASTILLLLGFLVYSWEDHRAKKPFSWGMLFYVFLMLVLYDIMTPLFMSVSGASGHYYEPK